MSIAGAIFVSSMVLGLRDKIFHKMISIYKVFLPVSVKAGISLNFQIRREAQWDSKIHKELRAVSRLERSSMCLTREEEKKEWRTLRDMKWCL